jgi:hypothetical protein
MQLAEHTYQPSKNILSRATIKTNKCHQYGAASCKPVLKRYEGAAI